MSTGARVEAVLRDAIRERVFPGAIVEVGSRRGVEATLAAGHLAYGDDDAPVGDDTVYDLASLTKVLCTTALAATLVEEGRVALDEPVHSWLPGWRGDDRRAVTLRHLLAHASGLPAHRPYFRQHHGADAIEAAICTEPLDYPPATRSVYSDPGFILLARVIERVGGSSLDEQFEAWRAAHLGDQALLRFNPPEEWRARTAPTEYDPWRGRLLRGEVHDENAAALGGVAGHAGLFGTAAAVGQAARWWMRRADERPGWRHFFEKTAVPGSSRALGWDTMLPTSSCGTRMSATAVGHTGFTGTSLWIDREADRYVVILSNRVHPTRAGNAIARVRPALHDAVAGDFVRS